MPDNKSLTAPCGLDCFNCELYEENFTGEFAVLLHKKFGVPKKALPCKGCRVQDGDHFHLPQEGCPTLTCTKEQDVKFCCDCEEFPCVLLAPIADSAAIYPHNMKLYNLCRIKKIGLEAWIDEVEQIRKEYFTGELFVGKGKTD